jgi:hypothetical protein
MQNSELSSARSMRREIKNCNQEISNHGKPNFIAWRKILKLTIKNHVWSRGMDLFGLV